MNISDNFINDISWKKYTSLKKQIDEKRLNALQNRITKKPFATDLEYLLGAFIEMYEPHLKEIILKFTEK